MQLTSSAQRRPASAALTTLTSSAQCRPASAALPPFTSSECAAAPCRVVLSVPAQRASRRDHAIHLIVSA